MISYEPLYDTLKQRNLSTNELIDEYNLSRNLFQRIRHNEPMTTKTLDKLCTILECDITDIIKFTHPNKNVVACNKELKFLIQYIRNTDFTKYKEKLSDGTETLSTEMVTLSALWKSYKLHNHISKTEMTDALLRILYNEAIKNKTYPFHSFTIFKSHME